jgi:hypothetical protein
VDGKRRVSHCPEGLALPFAWSGRCRRTRAAKTLCASCVVRSKCLDYALAIPGPGGHLGRHERLRPCVALPGRPDWRRPPSGRHQAPGAKARPARGGSCGLPPGQAFHFTFPSQRSIATVSPPPSLQRTEIRVRSTRGQRWPGTRRCGCGRRRKLGRGPWPRPGSVLAHLCLTEVVDKSCVASRRIRLTAPETVVTTPHDRLRTVVRVADTIREHRPGS